MKESAVSSEAATLESQIDKCRIYRAWHGFITCEISWLTREALLEVLTNADERHLILVRGASPSDQTHDQLMAKKHQC